MSPRIDRKSGPSPEAKRSLSRALAAQRERAFLLNLAALGIKTPIPEYRFHHARKFRFDYAWPDEGVALEVEGGVWSGGAHGRGTGIARDMAKYNLAAVDGWRVLRVVPKMLADPATARLVCDALTIQPDTPNDA